MEPITSQLYLLFSPSHCHGEPWATLRSALRSGVDLVQWRVKTAVEDDLARCRDLCNEHGVPLILNDRPDLVTRYDLAGAHLGQDDLDPRRARALIGPDRWLGLSTHDLEQIRVATADGADHFGFGPMFPTVTRGYTSGLGPDSLAAALGATSLPVFAIGGIDANNLPDLVGVGCRRIAVSSTILRAEDPARTTAALRELLPTI